MRLLFGEFLRSFPPLFVRHLAAFFSSSYRSIFRFLPPPTAKSCLLMMASCTTDGLPISSFRNWPSLLILVARQSSSSPTLRAFSQTPARSPHQKESAHAAAITFHNEERERTRHRSIRRTSSPVCMLEISLWAVMSCGGGGGGDSR